MPKMLFMRVKINTIIIFLVFIMDLMGYVKTLKPNSILVSNSIYIYIYRERERERERVSDNHCIYKKKIHL